LSDSKPDLVIRSATRADVGVIAQFIRELAEYERRAHEIAFTEESLGQALFGERPGAEVVLAELDGVEVGYALFFSTFSSFLGKPGIYLEEVIVRPAMRGRGIGRRLFAHVAALATTRGCARLEWSVLDWNESAIKFYEGLGAQSQSEWTVYRLTGAALERLAEASPATRGGLLGGQT